MGIGDRTLGFYFNYIYNPLYDYTTARTSPYRRLQQSCIERLDLQPGCRVLCVGIGTGNEIPAILNKNSRVGLAGVDMSRQALNRAANKASKLGKEIELHRMDAGKLEFAGESFDRVLCLHLTDFVPDSTRVTAEVIRVLKAGGRFVVTYPSGSGSFGLLADIGKNIGRNLRRGRPGEAAKELAAIVGGTFLYGPTALWLRGRRRFHKREGLEEMLAAMPLTEYSIEEDTLYQDFIVCGRK
ncbi:MAG: methyltransferase domain-containing protein [Dehalococcoidia bacterium]|nr:methyltransferase domain-containing protein [Dehalococcoidia bacterium]